MRPRRAPSAAVTIAAATLAAAAHGAADEVFEVSDLALGSMSAIAAYQDDDVADANDAAAVEAPILEEPDRPTSRGLVTSQGMSGMFLNPTSGTLPKGMLTLQYCVLLYQNDGPNNTFHGLMGAYGITDALEVGLFVNWIDVNRRGEDFLAGGPFVRWRILEDDAEGWLPEVSIGGIWIDGDADGDIIHRAEVFVAASKYFELSDENFLRGLRPHVGVRQIWRPDRPDITPTLNTIPGYFPEANATVAYVGLEAHLAHDLSLVGEVSTKDDFSPSTPWAVGAQWKPNDVLGLSLGAARSNGADGVSAYIGIGLNFSF